MVLCFMLVYIDIYIYAFTFLLRCFAVYPNHHFIIPAKEDWFGRYYLLTFST